MPNDKFWGPDELLAARPSRNYTVNDYEQFYSDIGYNLGYTLRKNTEKLIYDLNPPNVESVFYYVNIIFFHYKLLLFFLNKS